MGRPEERDKWEDVKEKCGKVRTKEHKGRTKSSRSVGPYEAV